jgi:PKD repeat protein
MKNNGKSMYKITLSVFTILMILTLLSAGASASITVKKTPLGAGKPPATQRLSCGCDRIDYTAVAASKSDPKIVQFRDLSKGKETYISWQFGDGTHLEGTKITSSLKNPVHKYKKTGYYITELTIRCGKCSKLLWVHKNVVIK